MRAESWSPIFRDLEAKVSYARASPEGIHPVAVLEKSDRPAPAADFRVRCLFACSAVNHLNGTCRDFR